MLSRLYIENIAVIERADIELCSGLNVLTGETGAGKSILVDSIMAVLGERTSRELIRAGAAAANVSALFVDIGSSALSVLSQYGIEPEDGEIILSRELKADGRGSYRINGRPVTASVHKAVGRQLINIHGQHDNQSLLDSDKHIIYLDAMLENTQPLTEYKENYKKLKELEKSLKQVNMDEGEKARKIDLLKYQIKDIRRAQPEPGELAELLRKRAVCANIERIQSSCEDAYDTLNGDDSEDGAVFAVQQAADRVAQIAEYSESLSALHARLSDISYELADVAEELRSELDRMEFDPGELEQLEERIVMLRRIEKKYGGEKEALEYCARAMRELEKIELSDEARLRLDAEHKQQLSVTKLAAERLTEARKQAGENTAKAICAELQYLDMPSAQFCVEITPCDMDEFGADRVEFLISANPGEPPRSISRIASGGELSRIMLAIKNVFADRDDIDTLIFDEIDTGVSGRAAQKIGYKLKAVSSDRQIVCITHLAQIAAFADAHLLIKKNVRDGRTFTTVSRLDREQRIHELAVINGGENITDTMLQSAAQLLDFAQQGQK